MSSLACDYGLELAHVFSSRNEMTNCCQRGSSILYVDHIRYLVNQIFIAALNISLLLLEWGSMSFTDQVLLDIVQFNYEAKSIAQAGKIKTGAAN